MLHRVNSAWKTIWSVAYSLSWERAVTCSKAKISRKIPKLTYRDSPCWLKPQSKSYRCNCSLSVKELKISKIKPSKRLINFQTYKKIRRSCRLAWPTANLKWDLTPPSSAASNSKLKVSSNKFTCKSKQMMNCSRSLIRRWFRSVTLTSTDYRYRSKTTLLKTKRCC